MPKKSHLIQYATDDYIENTGLLTVGTGPLGAFGVLVCWNTLRVLPIYKVAGESQWWLSCRTLTERLFLCTLLLFVALKGCKYQCHFKIYLRI